MNIREQGAASTAPPRIATPAITLPKGGGAIRSIGEKFASNPVTGTGTTAVNIPTSPGRGGIGPQLVLGYDSGAGNGVLGFGWSLALPSVRRKTDKGLPRYDDANDSDVFIMSGTEDLVAAYRTDENGALILDANGEPILHEDVRGGYRIRRYRPRVESGFARIERWTRITDGDTHWRSTSGDSVLTIYGKDSNSRIADPDDASRVCEWLICETRDDRGNAIVYTYKAEDATGVDLQQAHEQNRGASGAAGREVNRHLKRIRYGNRTPLLDAGGKRLASLTNAQVAAAEWLFDVIFDYGEHDATQPTPTDAGDWLCRNDPFSTYRAGFEVRTYRLCQRVLMFHHFEHEPGVGLNCLVRSTDFAYRNSREQPDDVRKGHPVATFLASITHRGYERDNAGYVNKSLPPLEFEYSEATIDEVIHELDAGGDNLPAGVDDTLYRWVDLDGEGLPGILTEQGSVLYYKRNLGAGRFDVMQPAMQQPSLSALGEDSQLLDVDNDGQLELANLGGAVPGFYERTDTEGWTDFEPFASLPRIGWNSRNVRFVDLTGDGRADVLVSEHDVLTWHGSLAQDGFGTGQRVPQALDEERGPRLVFADPTESIYLADMSGDGLVDLVRLRAGEVCYWPNLGYGRFGPRVVMDNAPLFDRPEQFSQLRVRLADIDGTGHADIIYLGAESVRIYFNQCGNGWSAPRELHAFPQIDDVTSVATVDLLGNGTACLVWSSPLPNNARRPLRYMNLMGSGKPHLLVRVINNTGGETRVHYASSTKFYLADRAQGTRWLTRLPFPVHVVDAVETIDHVSRTRFVTLTAYHHGCFDPVEREFRGFGMVEQWDTEAFEDYVAGIAPEGGQDAAPELFQPPVTRRTWFHTGAPHDHEAADVLQHEFYNQQHGLPAPALPRALDGEHLRECLRALKGLPLRQEVYSFDGSAAEQHPYRIVENSYEVRMLQPRGANRHAVFFPFGTQSLASACERQPADPRTTHTINLDVGRYGNVRQMCSIVYGRATADMTLPAEVREAQQRSYVTIGETQYTPAIDDTDAAAAYRLPVSCESRTFEITGVASAARHFTAAEIRTQLVGATELRYEESADGVTRQKRLLAHGRTLFLDDAGAAMPLGQWDTLGRTYESYQLAFTPQLLATQLDGQISNAELTAAGYVQLPAHPGWWLPSGTVVYPVNAGQRFYMPSGARDALGTETITTFDGYDLLPTQITITGVAWNVVTAVNDYRVLGPVLLRDPNGNRSAVRVDPLGMVVASAVMGKAGSADGDTLADPTVRLEYELLNWLNHGQPNFVHTFMRQQHGAANQRWQETVTYSNGHGSVAMVKVQAPPGTALTVDADGNATEVQADPRWVGSGRKVVNNKGHLVKSYQPYFSTTAAYEDEKALRVLGVTPIHYWDPIGRNIRTQFPNGTFARIDLTAWQQTQYDANDTVLDSEWYVERGSPDPDTDPEPSNDPERRAAWLAARHGNTPDVIHFDSLGRRCYAISDYGAGVTATVRTDVDLTGRNTRLFDAEGREVLSSFTGMTGTELNATTAEKGRRWTFHDALGALVRSWDEHGRLLRAEYDTMHRPTATYVTEPGQPEILFAYIVYGERHANAAQLNLLGAVHQVFDQSGTTRLAEADFKSNPLRFERMLANSYAANVDWSTLPAQPTYAALQAAANASLQTAEFFTVLSQYDALNRPTRVTLPDQTVISPTYNEANYLAALSAQVRGQGPAIEFLKDQAYDAKGQRQFVHYGNDVITRCFYDPKTFRLQNLLTYGSADDPETQALQDLHYTFDPVGNITQIEDDAQQTRYFSNAVVRPRHLFQYDALYQLIRATGREHAGLVNDAIRTDADVDFVPQLPHVNNAAAVRNYTEEYEYDQLGNLTELRHRFQTQAGAGSGWTRRYRYARNDNPADRTNRLTSTSLPGDPEAGPYTATYTYDSYGNIASMPHLAAMLWNFMDQLREVDLGGGGTAYYVYGSDGQRVRKVIERPGGTRVERIYLGNVEIHRERQGANAPHFERYTLHVADDSGRIAQVDTKTRDDNNLDPANALNTSLIRYQYGNHIGSASLETDEHGVVISYEEYHPYGTTAFRSAKPGFELSLKRYRFSGKARDSESGLYYFGARYYAPWLGRWTSTDPAGLTRGANLFRYCANSPVMFHDPNGMEDYTTIWTYNPRQYSAADRAVVENPQSDPAAVLRIFQAHGYRGGGPLEWRSDYGGGGWVRTTRSEVAPGQGNGGGSGGADSGNSGNSGGNAQAGDGGGGGNQSTPQPSVDAGGGGNADANAGGDPGGNDSGGSSVLPLRPLVQPGAVPQSPVQTSPIPRLDMTQAPPGTDFAREESNARANYRQANGLSGRNVAVQHPAKWRDGARTNLHPRVTNDPRFLHPISNVRGTGGTGLNGRQYATQHTLADRGNYPTLARDTAQRYGDYATERVTHVWTGQRSRQMTTGSRGPLFLREYIVAPMLRGAGGHFALASTRTFVPFVVEAELGLMGTGMVLANAGYTTAGAAVFGAAAYVPVAGGGLVAGAIAGNAVENVARELGASQQTAESIGAVGALAAGAGVGALIGSVIPGVGTAAGAVVGGAFGLIGYGLSKLF